MAVSKKNTLKINRLLAKLFAISILLTCISCQGAAQQNSTEDFNKEASIFFIRNNKTSDLDPLNESDKCLRCEISDVINSLDRNVSNEIMQKSERDKTVSMLNPFSGTVYCYRLEGVGYLCHIFKPSKSQTSLDFEVMLVPDATRTYITRIDAISHPECYRDE